jgi:hypothetical protein
MKLPDTWLITYNKRLAPRTCSYAVIPNIFNWESILVSARQYALAGERIALVPPTLVTTGFSVLPGRTPARINEPSREMM